MNDMTSDLMQLLGDIRARTGADVRLSPAGGEETPFELTFRGRKIPAWIAGMGATAEREARLVEYLVESAGEARAVPDKRDELKSILLGEGNDWSAFRFLTKHNFADGTCFALDLVPEKRLNEAAQHVERCLDGRDMSAVMDDMRIAVVRFAEEGQSAYEFGQFLAQSLYEETGVRAGVGIGCEVRSFSEISLSYNQAATAVRMSGIFHAKGEVHSYREYLLVRLLEEVPKAKLSDCLEQFRMEGAAEIFEDEDMAATAEEFLESSLNISETSRNLYMHRNTLMYRLDKIERLTGLNIRKFSDAVTFRVIGILYKLLQA